MTKKFARRGATLDIRVCREIKNQFILSNQFMRKGFTSEARESVYEFLEKVDQ